MVVNSHPNQDSEPPPDEVPERDRPVDAIAAARDEAEKLRGTDPVLGTPGPPVDRRSPFMWGLMALAGIAVTYAVVHLVTVAANILAVGLVDYLIVPKIIGRVVHVPVTVTLISVLVGAAGLGLIGALIAIPTAATIDRA